MHDLKVERGRGNGGRGGDRRSLVASHQRHNGDGHLWRREEGRRGDEAVVMARIQGGVQGGEEGKRPREGERLGEHAPRRGGRGWRLKRGPTGGPHRR